MDVHGFSVCGYNVLTSNTIADDATRMLGSLTFYRRFLNDNLFSNSQIRGLAPSSLLQPSSNIQPASKLPTLGHAIAGVMAGWTVSFIAAPVEHVKARLQIQYAVDKTNRMYKGPM